MTPETVGAGWLLVAAFLLVAGAGVVYLGRSAWSERRAARSQPEPVSLPVLSPSQRQAWEAHVADAIAQTELASVTDLPRRNVIPMQRRGDSA